MRDHIVLYLNGSRREVRGAAAFLSISDYVRQEAGLMGTKVVCAEGDCGSCTVLLGRAVDGVVQYRSVCSCIQFVFQADGCHIVTVEGVGDVDNLNPVQEALVTHHGTQCGYCTPGIVMSIHALLETDAVLTEQRLREGLVGNLCRCTGYDPIVRAGMAVDSCRVKRMNKLFNSPEMLAELSSITEQPLRVQCDNKLFYKAATLADAIAFKAAQPECVIVSGATDLGVQVNKGARELTKVMSIASVSELHEVHLARGVIFAGANTTIGQLQSAASESIPEYAHLLSRFGSPQIRNAATIGGNIANGSPIGDTMPALFALDAEVELAGPGGTRRVNINDFYAGYKKTVAAPHELISRVLIPTLKPDEQLKLYKISKRADLDISTFSAAIWLKFSGSTVDDVRIAFGGVAATIVRLRQAETYLRGTCISAETFAAAGEIAASEVSPISDVRSSAQYRQKLSANIFRKLYQELSSKQVPASTV